MFITKTNTRRAKISVLGAVLLGGLIAGCSQPDTQEPTPETDTQNSTQVLSSGEAVYNEYCAACHDNPDTEAPTKASIQLLGLEAIQRSLNSGVMQEQASILSSVEKRIVAEYLAAPETESAIENAKANLCKGTLSLNSSPVWNRWGNGLRNTRFQSADNAGIDLADIPKLELKWAFGFPGAARARSQPAVTKEAIFTGSQSGLVYALDTQTGCIWWTFSAKAEVRSAPTIVTDDAGRPETLYFGDFDANVYAVDALTGDLIWTRSAQDHKAGTITGSMTYYNDRLYVPMSSTEVINAYSPTYECCTFRGGVTALNATTGETLWRFYTVDDPQKTGTNSEGATQYGPSGAPVWSPPTIDEKRGLLYVGTGENYSSPANDKSDAIIALKLETGAVEWVSQTIEGDAWNGGCGPNRNTANCPEENGPDFDFGAPPILFTLDNGQDIILAGQKSGMVFGMDPDDKGNILWETRAGMGGFNGGVHWGMATDRQNLYVGIADTPGNKFAVGPSRQGLHVYNPATGKPIWSKFEPNVCEELEHKCMTALSSPPTVTPDAVFAGALNGILRVYSKTDGEILWTTDTRRAYETVNNITARGGAIDSGGPVVADGLLIVNSGYDKFGQIPGNVLLVYGVKDKGDTQ